MVASLDRFEKVQKDYFEKALEEIKNGCKLTHWMWFIFPQIHGLGKSATSKFYEIKSVYEAREYLKNKYLYNNLIEICKVLLSLETNDSILIFGFIDSMKLKSSMTLFDFVLKCESLDTINYCNLNDNLDIFEKVLEKFFDNNRDLKTIEIAKNDLLF